MRYEEEDHREHNDQDRHHNRDRRRSHQEEEEEFNDFRSRWDEPEPLFRQQRQRFYDDGPHSHNNFAHPRDEDYRGGNQWHPRDERNEYRDQEEQRHEGYRQVPNWRRRDVDFSRENQHANDRWSQNNYMPHPERERNDDYERFKWEREQQRDRHRARGYRDYRDGEGHERND